MAQKTAIIYARVSSPGQAEEELPIQSQIDVGYKKAAELGADVVKVFLDEGISGRTDEREAFQQAIVFCRARKIDYFICWNTARFFRNREEAPWYKKQLRTHGTSMIYVSQNIDVSKKDGRLMEGFYELMDDHRSQEISEDTLRSMLLNATNGNFNGGTIPYGYISVPDGRRRRLNVNQAEAPIVRAIFSKFVSGTGTRTIAKEMNSGGLRRRGRPWTKNHIIYMLKNRVYTGYIIFHRQNHVDRSIRPEAEWIQTKAHEPIVSEEIFQQAQGLFTKRTSPRQGGTPRSRFIFSGLLRCGVCDEGLQIETATGRSKSYSYYNCRGALKGTGCKHRRLAAGPLDQWLLDFILDRILSADHVREVVEHLHELKGKWVGERETRRAALVAEMRNIEGRRSRLYEVLELQGRDAPDLSTMGPRIRALTDRIRAIEGEREALDTHPLEQITLKRIPLDEMAGHLREVISTNEDPIKVREFLGGFITQVTITVDQAIVQYRPDRMVGSGGGEPVRGDDGCHPISACPFLS